MVGKPTESSAAEPSGGETDRETRDQGAGPLAVERLRKDDGRALLLYTLPTDARPEP